MPLTKLQFKPGVNRETTSYSNEGGWFDGDKIRFRFGFPEKIGGWERTSPNTYLGTARSMHPFNDLNETNLLGVGTNVKYYIVEGLGFNDITPVRAIFTSFDFVGGVEGTGNVGAVGVLINPSFPTGLQATSQVGSVGVFINDTTEQSVFVTGSQGNGFAGTATAFVNTAVVDGLEAAGEVNAVTVSVPTVDVDGLTAAGAVSSVAVAIT
jgi:hypothetical protein